MQNQLFRQKSLEKIQSPEVMHDYMRVTSPRLWMILTAIVVLLGGFIAYASTTTMESTMRSKCMWTCLNTGKTKIRTRRWSARAPFIRIFR